MSLPDDHRIYPIEAWMQGVAGEESKPVGGASGSAVDAAETLPMLQPDSQPPEGYFEPKQCGESDPFVAELFKKNHAGVEEGAKKEHETDDDMVEPIMTHEEFEELHATGTSPADSKKEEQTEKPKVEEKLKEEEQNQIEEQTSQPQKPEGALPEQTDMTKQPVSPSCNVLDSDEEINKKKKGNTTVKGTFQDTCWHIFFFYIHDVAMYVNDIF